MKKFLIIFGLFCTGVYALNQSPEKEVPANSEPTQQITSKNQTITTLNCELLDGYYFGMNHDEANSNYNTKTHNNLICNSDKFSANVENCSGYNILGTQSNFKLVFDEKGKLAVLSAIFNPNDYATIKQGFFNNFGQPTSGGQCKNPELFTNGSCEGYFWKMPTAHLQEFGLSKEAEALRWGAFLIAPINAYTNCKSSSPQQTHIAAPEHLDGNGDIAKFEANPEESTSMEPINEKPVDVEPIIEISTKELTGRKIKLKLQNEIDACLENNPDNEYDVLTKEVVCYNKN